MSAPRSTTTSRICHPANSLCLCSNPPTRSTSPLANGTPSECSRCHKRPQSPAPPRTGADQPLASNTLSYMGGDSTPATGGPDIDLAAIDSGNRNPIRQGPTIPDGLPQWPKKS